MGRFGIGVASRHFTSIWNYSGFKFVFNIKNCKDELKELG